MMNVDYLEANMKLLLEILLVVENDQYPAIVVQG